MSRKPRPANPYSALPERQFWRPAVADRGPLEIDGLWTAKFPITAKTAIATYGSCFAQHIGQALNARGFNWLVTEPGPLLLTEAQAKRFNFGVFSSRTGNIYTTSLLAQWVSWADGSAAPPDEVWAAEDGRLYDPFRPAVEPGGFADREELERTRAATIAAFRASIVEADVFVFTLGLTESWINASEGYEYPMCPGTHAGVFDPKAHVFVNQDYATVEAALTTALDAMRAMNPKLKVLLTVSPVPLTATNSGAHVLVATVHSKSILRAVAGQLAATMDDVDYFPSYEIVSAPPFRGAFFKANQRSMSARGVDFVMEHFFAGVTAPAKAKSRRAPAPYTEPWGEVCEDALLDAFGPAKPGNRAP